MRYQVVIAFACGSMVAVSGAVASGQFSAVHDAKQLAACIQAMDAPCVVRLSDRDAYREINPPEFNFEAVQTRMYKALRGKGISYTRFDIGAPTTTSAEGGTRYQIVPFSFAMSGGDKPAQASRGYFVAISRDKGRSWRFIDASTLTVEQLRKIMPTYSPKMSPPLA